MARHRGSPIAEIPHGEFASLILENALEYAIFTLNFDGRITSWNPGAGRIFGYSREEAIGMDFAALFTAPDVSANVPGAEIERARRKGRAEDSRWHVRKGGARFWANGVTMSIEGSETPVLLKITRDETPTKLADEQRVLLLNELNHRIKNTLATVQSIVDHTLRVKSVDPAVRNDLTSRLIALSDAHNILVEQSWAGADLMTIVAGALQPFARVSTEVFTWDGPPTRLSARQAVAMALVLHELATNAVKYGALKAPTGLVTVTWNQAIDSLGGRHLTLLWEERGGPAVAPPERSGFGSRLISRSFGNESGGRAHVEFAPDGVRCVVELPLSTDSEMPMLAVGQGSDEERAEPN
jgi:PAS domain S-box-containing protein